MGWPVVLVDSGGMPVTESANGIGMSVSVSDNGYGQAVTIVESGGMPIVWAESAFAVNESKPSGYRWVFVTDDADGSRITDDATGKYIVDLKVL